MALKLSFLKFYGKLIFIIYNYNKCKMSFVNDYYLKQHIISRHLKEESAVTKQMVTETEIENRNGLRKITALWETFEEIIFRNLMRFKKN
jgi:hypothetical protein